MKKLYNTPTKDELLCVRAYEVIENLHLIKLEISHDKPTRFPTSYKSAIHKDDVKTEIMKLGKGMPSETNFTFIEKVFKQIIYYLKYND
jgi:hypothetical protein